MQHTTTVINRRSVRVAFAAVAACLGVTACSSGDSTSASPSSAAAIAFTTSASAAGDISAAAAPVTVGAHTLNLTAVSLTISRAELKRAQSDSCPGDHDGDDDHPAVTPSTQNCGELKIGPTTVNLPLDTNVVTIPANTIPAGTFREFELRVSQVEIKGTFDGQAFDDTIAVNAKSEIQFSIPLVVTAGSPAAVTVNVPVNTWLMNSDGTLINPLTLKTNPSLLAQVRSRISASFRAFEDHNHDGREDHDGGDGGNGR
jgi:hypothetical protein